MDGIRLIFAHVFLLLLFTAFGETNLKFIDASSNANLAPMESNNAPEMRANRLRRKNHDAVNDVLREEQDDIRPQAKRAGRSGREPRIWDRWSSWSTCSVTCGIGKIVRWRHCIGGSCSPGQKRAQLRTCTSAAC